MKAILLMAHGAPKSIDDVEEYVLHIRHGRPLEAAQMDAIKERYRMIGGSPLIERTEQQALALQNRLAEENTPHKVFTGMRHSPPFIAETIQRMHHEGVTSIIAICMAPQFSNLTIGAYEQALQNGIAETHAPISYELVKSFSRHPKLIEAFAKRIQESLDAHPSSFVIFTAHSLPEKILQQADPYDYEVKETARLVAQKLALADWRFAYQSQGMTSDKWLGPTVEARIEELSAKGIREILIAPIGFVCDHVEILYDVDVMFRNYAQERGITLHRSASLNDSPEFISLLFELVRGRL
jgi:ferrochelatase